MAYLLCTSECKRTGPSCTAMYCNVLHGTDCIPQSQLAVRQTVICDKGSIRYYTTFVIIQVLYTCIDINT